MRQDILRMRAVLTALLLMGAVLLLWRGSSLAAAPTLGDGCGVGANIVGSDLAGKVTMGGDVTACTLTFGSTFPNAPACTAVNETSRGGQAAPVGVRSTTTTLVFDGTAPVYDGDVVSYLCVGY
ncbi:MAG: hypothetical protein ACRERE_02955 [Candidatus Entotheonellia bacterium]